MNRTISAAALCGTIAALGGAVPSAHASPSNALTLAPAHVAGVAESGTRIGPLRLSNGTDKTYRVQVIPVLLRQSRSGIIAVRDDAGSVAAARRAIRSKVTGFTLGKGASRSVAAVARNVERGFSGGLLFRAVPAHRGAGITSILQLNGSIFLRPPNAETRIEALAGRAEQAGPAELRLLTTVRNSGSAYAAVSGRIAVRDGGGRVVARSRIDARTLIPGATVDLPATLRQRLPAAAYTVEATVRSGKVRRSVSSRMTLFGPNEVRTENAKLARMDSPEGFEGEPFAVTGSFTNTGNVPYAPRASYEVRATTSGPDGKLLARGPLDVRTALPGERGTIGGKLELPTGVRSANVAIVLSKGERELDRRDVAVTLQVEPSLSARVSETVARHPMMILTVMLAAVLAAVAAMATVVIRR